MRPPPVKPQLFRILLVGTRYDEFTLEEAGFHAPDAKLPPLEEEDLQTGRWLQHLEMDNVFVTAETAAEALEVLKKEAFDIVICDYMVGSDSSIPLSRRIKRDHPSVMAVLLTSNPLYAGPRPAWPEKGAFDIVLTWHGNGQLLRSIVLLQKDTTPAASSGEFRPRAILLVEDEPGLAGLYLPLIHEEIFSRMREILPETPPGDMLLKILAERPRLLYATTYEEAVDLVKRWGDEILGVITDVQFTREGRLEAEAGFELVRFIRRLYPTLPIAIQSRDPDIHNISRALGAHFLHKEPMKLLSKLKGFMIDYLGFGPFIFRTTDGTEVARARDIRELARAMKTCPLESFLYHAGNNHFSAWLSLHGHRALAVKFAPMRAYNELDRQNHVRIVREYISEVFPDRCVFF